MTTSDQGMLSRRGFITTSIALAGVASWVEILAATTSAGAAESPRTCVFGEFEVLPGQQAHVLQLVQALTDAVRQELGCVMFLPYRFAADTDRYHIHEVYRDAAAFEAHLKAEHTVTFNEALKAAVVGGATSVTHLVEAT